MTFRPGTQEEQEIVRGLFKAAARLHAPFEQGEAFADVFRTSVQDRFGTCEFLSSSSHDGVVRLLVQRVEADPDGQRMQVLVIL